MIELNPDRHDELAALIAHHMEAGRRNARSGALVGARRLLGGAPAGPHDALRLWRTVMELAEELEESEETTALAVMSRLLQLDFAWRLGMDDEEEARLDRRGARRSRRGPATCARWRCCRWRPRARPGHAARRRTWLAAVAESEPARRRIGRPAPAGRDPRRRLLRLSSAPPTSSGFERALDEVLELCRRRPPRRRRDRHRQPVRLGDDGEGPGAARARPARGGRRAVRRGAADRRPSRATRRSPAGPAATRR